MEKYSFQIQINVGLFSRIILQYIKYVIKLVVKENHYELNAVVSYIRYLIQLSNKIASYNNPYVDEVLYYMQQNNPTTNTKSIPPFPTRPYHNRQQTILRITDD